MRTALLELAGLTKRFGGLVAVSNFSLTLKEGELVGLIGPNGAGKTSVFNLITGMYVPTAGRVVFRGQDVTGWRPSRVAQLGVARTFQNIRLFGRLSVLDNVRVACHHRGGSATIDAILRTPRFRSRERHMVERARELLAMLGLESRSEEQAKNLPYGEQRRLEIARALVSEPALLLLDEPAAGMNPSEAGRLMELIHLIRDRFKLTVLLIEHQMQVVMGVCERVVVMEFGETIASGIPEEVQKDPNVIEAYLGTSCE